MYVAGDCIMTDEYRVPVPVVTFLGMVRESDGKAYIAIVDSIDIPFQPSQDSTATAFGDQSVRNETDFDLTYLELIT